MRRREEVPSQKLDVFPVSRDAQGTTPLIVHALGSGLSSVFILITLVVTGLHTCKTSSNCTPKKVYFTVCQFYFNKRDFEKVKKGWRYSSVVDHFPSRHEALGLISRPTKIIFKNLN
jgi:hypothetical protein